MSERLDDDVLKEFVPIPAEDFEDFGTCCVCGCDSSPERPVRNFICLDFKQPVPGNGWGCVVCNLPPEGALAVICDRCLEEENFNYKFIVSGDMSDKSRIPYPENREHFAHDESKHQEFESMTIGTVSDPSWDYAACWQQLSEIFRELSELQCYLTDQEQATVQSDLHIHATAQYVAAKLNNMSYLLVHPIEEADEF